MRIKQFDIWPTHLALNFHLLSQIMASLPDLPNELFLEISQHLPEDPSFLEPHTMRHDQLRVDTLRALCRGMRH